MALETMVPAPRVCGAGHRGEAVREIVKDLLRQRRPAVTFRFTITEEGLYGFHPAATLPQQDGALSRDMMITWYPLDGRGIGARRSGRLSCSESNSINL